MPRYVVVHGHFYQPPRESPFTGHVRHEPSAHPFHDWNQRIASECYQPLSRARILDPEGHELPRFDCYRHMSFNFGPTLLAWMQAEAPATYDAVLAADAASKSAIAQAHGHVILPLATRRDKETQVRWGLRDFELRFGRRAEGMWMPETACDLETLDVLATEGVRFTIVSPMQIARVKKGDAFRAIGPDRLDTRRPYLVPLPSGRTMTVFAYDGDLANAVAFRGVLRSGADLVALVMSKFSGADGELVHFAVDGETFGHHHRWGDMALASALTQLAREPGVVVTTYADYLRERPATELCELATPSAWSCAHGVGRWSRDCGCKFEEGSRQGWRAPLRAVLDDLRDEIHAACLGVWPECFEARDRYVDDKLGRPGAWTPAQKTLLQVLDHAMSMFTSCGWFFDHADGIEGTIVLLHAARALELLRPLVPGVGARFEVELARIPARAGTLADHLRVQAERARSA